MSASRWATGSVNARWRPDRTPTPPDPGVLRFHQALPGYRPTPLLDGVLPALPWVSVKDESDRFGLPSFKILGASWAVHQTLRRHPTTHTLVAASAGNHGRAVARAAADRGLRCRIILPAGTSARRADPIAAEGAVVETIAGDYDAAVGAAERAATAAGTALIADVARDPHDPTAHWVAEGYSTLFREVAGQVTEPAQVLLVPVGVGSLASAAVRWAAHEGHRAAVVGVEPATAACVTESLVRGWPLTVPTPGTSMAGLNCATPSAAAWPVLRDGLAGTLTVRDETVHAAMRELAGHGLALGDCGAAAVAAVRQLRDDPSAAPLRDALRLTPTTRILCVGTEGPTDPVAYRATVGTVGTG